MNPVIAHLHKEIAMIIQPVLPAAAPRPSLLDRMEIAMRELAFCGQTVDEEALAQRGFTSDEISRHWQAARDLANLRAIRQKGEPTRGPKPRYIVQAGRA